VKHNNDNERINVVRAEDGILLTHKHTDQRTMFRRHTFPHKPFHWNIK